MHRNILVYSLVLAFGMGGIAVAQTSTSSGTTTTGIAKPPPGMLPPSPRNKLDHSHAMGQSSSLTQNTPTLPQIALHPTATVGSPVPISGPGGTSRSPTGY